jgi:hypothetical protein
MKESKTQYELVVQSEDGTTDGDAQNRGIWLQPMHRYRFVAWACLTIILSSIAGSISYSLSAALTTASSSAVTSYPEFTDCGSTPAEARSRGCSFDVMSFAWQTPLCYDPSLIEEFLAFHNWTYYTDGEHGITVPLETVLKGDVGLWVTWKYHVTHCSYMYRQMHRAYENGWIDSHIRSNHHTIHCHNMLLRVGIPDYVTDEMVFTTAALLYPTCDKVGATGVSVFDKIYGGEE